MRIIGCDSHARQQTLAILDTETGQLERVTLMQEGNNVRDSQLPRPGAGRHRGHWINALVSH